MYSGEIKKNIATGGQKPFLMEYVMICFRLFLSSSLIIFETCHWIGVPCFKHCTVIHNSLHLHSRLASQVYIINTGRAQRHFLGGRQSCSFIV